MPFAAYGRDIPEAEGPERIPYVTHGVTRTRIGLPYDSQKVVLADVGGPGNKSRITYDPSHGYTIEPSGIEIRPSGTFILQGTPNPNTPPGSGKFGVSWLGYLDFYKKLGDWGSLFLQLQEGWGDTVEPDLALFSNVNSNAFDIGGRITARKYRYEQYLFDNQVTVRCGKLRAYDWFDQNAVADDDDTEFLNDMFNSSEAVDWPSNFSFGEEVTMAPRSVDFLELDLGHFEGNDKWQQLFKHGMYVAQATIKSARLFKIDPEQWAGSYRFYGWLNNRDHSKYVTRGQTRGAGEYTSYGFGLSADQMVTSRLVLFGRFGWQQPDMVPARGGACVEWSWSGGVQICGAYWSRVQDHIAVAVGQNFVSKEYIDAGNPGANEGHVEAYYSWKLNRCLTISPDVQLIWNPNGVSTSRQGDGEPVFVYGVRTHYVF